ncbi:MAG: aspartate aminotransferase family protein [Sedimentisphaerales bacterium]
MSLAIAKLCSKEVEAIHSTYRRIRTAIPAEKSIVKIEKLRVVEPISMQGMPPIFWQEAEGFLVRDDVGNQWIDLTSGIVLANVGHSHPKIKKAIIDAVENNLLLSYAFPAEMRGKLLEKLVSLSPIPDSKAILYSAGTEATECAMALMRRHGNSISKRKTGILGFLDSYHGRTLSARLAGGTPNDNDWIQRETVGHYQMPFPFCPRCPWGKDKYENCGKYCFHKCIESIEQRNILPDMIAGIIAEPMPGWATWPIPLDFCTAMQIWAKKNDILLTFDEIQSGCGRSGKLFALEHLGIIPDFITLGKGLSSSLPVSAVIGPKWLMDQPAPGEMSSTHGGNPICAAAALACLGVLEEENLIEMSAKTGDLILGQLQRLQLDFPQHFFSIHGKGLFISVHLKKATESVPDIELADAIVYEAIRRGVLMFPTGRGFLKIVPPLCINSEAALEAVDVIRECFISLKNT